MLCNLEIDVTETDVKVLGGESCCDVALEREDAAIANFFNGGADLIPIDTAGHRHNVNIGPAVVVVNVEAGNFISHFSYGNGDRYLTTAELGMTDIKSDLKVVVIHFLSKAENIERIADSETCHRHIFKADDHAVFLSAG